MIRRLADAGVVVSAGHTNATYAHDPRRRCAQGLTRLHAPVQRDVAADQPRARRGRRGARGPRQLVRPHRRRPPRPPGGRCGSRCAAKRLDRFMLVTDAMPSGRHRRRIVHAAGPAHRRAGRRLRRRERHARRLRPRHGERGAQRGRAARAAARSSAVRMASTLSRGIPRPGRRAGPHRAGLPRQPGRWPTTTSQVRETWIDGVPG